MDSPAWHKFDTGLKMLYSDYLLLHSGAAGARHNTHPALKSNPERVYFSLEYTGELSVLEAAGFQTTKVAREGLVEGSVLLTQLAAFSQHPQVLLFHYGQRMKTRLESSVAEIMARGSGKVWDVNQLTGVFSGFTGRNVVIGIIDTGIDWRHPNFLEANAFTTRILKIWDMGLVPQTGERGPDASLVQSGQPYGVEYTSTDINNVWAGTAPASSIRHLDCVGHGTHVAGIAAGNGRQAALDGRQRFEYCGVAPEAKLVVVKMLSLIHEPPESVTNLVQFKDAITYILRVAAATGTGLPAVINCSFGNDEGPSDGLNENGTDGRHSFLNDTFGTAPGKICVFAAGNAAGKRLHAEVTIPAGGSVEIPLEVRDARIFKETFSRCTYESSSHALSVELYYPAVAGVEAAFQPPGRSFSGNVALNGAPITNSFFNGRKSFSLFHDVTSAPRGGTTVQRNHITLVINPDGDTFQNSDAYRLRISGPAGTVLQLWCSQGSGFGVRVGVTVPAEVDVNDRHTIGPPADAASVITVGAYRDSNLVPADPATAGYLACFSARGPLADYSGSGPVADKPDIVAPGVQVHSAHSYQSRIPIENVANGFVLNGVLGFHYRAMQGTSMAAPHIAGVIALMLQKDPLMTQAVAKQRLQAAARPRPKKDVTQPFCSGTPAPSPGDPVAGPHEAGAGKVDAAAVVQAIP